VRSQSVKNGPDFGDHGREVNGEGGLREKNYWCEMVQFTAKWCEMVQNGANYTERRVVGIPRGAYRCHTRHKAYKHWVFCTSKLSQKVSQGCPKP
jgi:hypothetical protein